MHELVREGNLFGAIFAFLLALSVLFLPRRRVSNIISLLALVCGGMIMLYSWLNMTGIFFRPSFLNYMFIPFLFGLGPSTHLFYFSTLAEDEFRLEKRHWLMFLPMCLLLAGFPVVHLVNPGAFPEEVMGFFLGKPAGWLEKLMVVGFFINGIYYVAVYRESYSIFTFRSLREEKSARIFLAIFFAVGFLTVYAISAFYFRDIMILYRASFITALLFMGGFIFRQRFPEYFTDLETALERDRYSKSQLGDRDLREIHLQIIELMSNDKLYMDDKLTLAKLAEELDLTPHQLSEFLNRHLGYNFSQFVNNFRIEKAAKLLLEKENVNILSVAYEVGFSSKATFNLAFQNVKGMSPREYMKSRRN